MTIVRTTAGLVKGFVDKGLTTFLAVPYAAPITKARRFQAPQPVEQWSGIRNADRLSEVCPQIATYGPVGTNATSSLASGIDFMTVNIRTPSLEGAAPVLVWIHGGGYAAGSANEEVLQSGAFAASGIVEVTVNYRLGVLGFLYLGDGRPANRGLLDQIAALTWVRDNIAAFGGDPSRVTLAGRSAGGFSVAALMAMPSAHGLYARALPQSGASTAVIAPSTAMRVTERFLAAAGLRFEELEDAPIDTLLAAQKLICDESYTHHDFARDGAVTMLGVPLVPVIDDASLPEHPESAAAAGRTAPVPMMIGCTTGEYVTHATMYPDMSYDDAARLLDPRVRPVGLTGSTIVERYRDVLPAHSGKGIWRAVGGDLVFQNPTTRFARLHARHQAVFKYLFGAVEPDEMGAPHGAEVGLVWHREGSVTGGDDFAARVHRAWASFIADGCPVLPGTSSWRPISDSNFEVARLYDGKVLVGQDPFQERPSLWEPELSTSTMAT